MADAERCACGHVALVHGAGPAGRAAGACMARVTVGQRSDGKGKGSPCGCREYVPAQPAHTRPVEAACSAAAPGRPIARRA
jgi:hypothetical protein